MITMVTIVITKQEGACIVGLKFGADDNDNYHNYDNYDDDYADSEDHHKQNRKVVA